MTTLDEYQRDAAKFDRIKWTDHGKRAIALMGALGEFGSVISEVKKNRRDEDSYGGFKRRLEEELGDLLWYVSAIASNREISLGDLGNVEPLPGDDAWFELAETLAKLAKLMNQSPAAENSAIAPRIAAAITHIRSTTQEYDVEFEAVMRRNLEKAKSRWEADIERAAPQFDELAPKHEQLPREVEIEFYEIIRSHGKPIVYLRCKDITIGDRLTDNSYNDDNYRFHDAFHLANAATLGWSPVTRALFNCKRKSDPKKDEVEDGARAQIIEEAISFLVFDHAQQYNLMEEIKTVDQDLIRQVRSLVTNLEPAKQEIWEWDYAIRSGYRVFRALIAEPRGGRVKLSAANRSIEYLGPVDPEAAHRVEAQTAR